jgi:hypothetical protein
VVQLVAVIPAKDKCRGRCGVLAEPSDGLEPSTLPLPSGPGALSWVAAPCGSGYLSHFRASAICDGLPACGCLAP